MPAITTKFLLMPLVLILVVVIFSSDSFAGASSTSAPGGNKWKKYTAKEGKFTKKLCESKWKAQVYRKTIETVRSDAKKKGGLGSKQILVKFYCTKSGAWKTANSSGKWGDNDRPGDDAKPITGLGNGASQKVVQAAKKVCNKEASDHANTIFLPLSPCEHDKKKQGTSSGAG